MGKTIIFNENSLMAIKDSLDGIKAGNDDIASPNDVYVNEAAPEVDEFTIGGEEDSPVGGVYYHTTDDKINESYGRNCLTTCDLSEVGKIVCDNWTYDEDEYQEYLVDNELEDTLENKTQYIEDNVEFEIELFDNQIYHHMDSDYVYYDDLIDAFGEKFADNIKMGMLKDGSYSFYTEDLYEDEVYDINNPQELTDIAMKILPHGDYYQGCRGFILPNGVIVYTEGEHSDVTRIPGIDDKFQFVKLGNIRILQNSVDIGAEPTWQQEETLRKVIASYEGEEFYLDIFDNGSEIGAKYQNADYHYIMGEIDRFYSEGIKPQGGSFYEGKEMKNIDIIKENYEPEVKSSEVSLSSFKKKNGLAPKIWKDRNTLDSKVRLKLLDIADDFWEFVNLTWVEPKGIILTGSICNFNWSKFSDIDLHLVVDFNEVDERTDFVREYLDAKKNEWNNEHESLKIMGFQVELYVQNIDEMPESGGIYDLEENKWVRKPNKGDIKPIGLSKYAIKDKAATIMTIIDDMCDVLESTDDMYDIRQLDDDASHLWKKVKDMRTSSLEKNGEGGAGNIVYKVMRRMGYLDKLFDLRGKIYDKLNSISEATHKFKVLMIETLDENKELLKEYLDNNYGLPLYKYFKWAEKATDKEKAKDLFWHNPYIIEKYLEDVSDYDEELEELQDELYNDGDLVYDEEFIDRVINALERNNLLRRIIENAHVYAYAEDLPTWMTMDFIRLVKNEWCIHFTSDAYNIAREGFTGGTPEIDDLAYTGAGRQKHYAGYDFAFLIYDRNVDFNNYGNEAVIFRASGVLATHYSDEQDQVIFWGPSVKEIIPIKKDKYSSDWEIEGLDGQIFKTGKPSELADWATDNLPQYRKQILAGKSGYQPWGFSRPPYDNEFLKTESSKINEEVVADGNAEHNPYEKRWKAERQALKDFLVNCGKIMTSKENGKQYKVYYDQTISNLIGYNYCICVQWDPIEMKPESTIYIRALDKFTNRIFQAQYDSRGRDNMRGTYDDMGYSQRFESRNTHKTLITEANNKKRAKNQTIRVLAQGLGMDINSPRLASLESDFRNVYFNHIGNQEMDRVIMYEPLFAKCALDLGFGTDNYNDDDFVNYVNYLILKTKDSQNYSEIIGYYKSKISSYDDMVNVVGDEIKAKRDSERKEMANMEVNVNQNYEIRGPLSFDEAHEIGMKSCPNSIICYTKYEDTWLSRSYSNNNKNKCYVLLRNDWENYNNPEMTVHDGSERDNGLSSPLNEFNGYDNYGLSMIFVWIDPYGNLYKSNTRWNHEASYAPNHGVDTAMTETDIARLMGEPFEQVFNVEKVDKLEKIKERLANGEDLEDIFDYCVCRNDFSLVVTIDGKHNILREDNTFVWDKPIEEWFNYCSFSDYGGGCALVSIKEKYNFLKSDGTLVWKNDEWPDTSSWFDWVDEFSEGVAYVKIGISVNYLRLDGTLVWKNDDFPDISYWFSEMSDHFFKKGEAAVKIGLHWYYLKLDGKLYDYNDNLVAESKTNPKLLTESNNSKAAANKTKRLIAQLEGLDVNNPKVGEIERKFENEFFGAENYSADWFIVLEPNAYSWAYGDGGDEQDAKRCLDYVKKIGDNIFPEKQINTQYCEQHNINYDGTVSLKELLSPEQLEELKGIKAPYREKRNAFITQVRQINDLFDVESFVMPTIEQMNKENRRVARERKANGEETTVKHNPNYEIKGPLTRMESKVYGDRSAEDGSSPKICYTQGDSTWLNPRYSDDNTNKLFILLSKDWKDVKAVHDGSEKDNVLGAPYNKLSGYDRYGMSMIFLWINPGGALYTSNTRWNHSGGFRVGDVDEAFTQEAIEKLMGCSLSEITKMDSVDDKIDELEERLANGEDIRSVFDNVEQYGDVFLVRVGNRYNLVRKDGTFVWNRPYNKWFVEFDLCNFTVNGEYMFFTLSIGDGNFVLGDIYGNIYNDKSFIRRFNELAQTCDIKFNQQYNYVNGNPNLKFVYFVYDRNYSHYRGYKANIYNFKEKRFVFDTLFDDINSLPYGDDTKELILVNKNGGKNIANLLNGELIYKGSVNRWFNNIYFSQDSNKNLMTVEYYNDGNYSYNIMDWNGNILLKENAPYITEFMNGVCAVENDEGDYFFMTEDLQPLDGKMFDSIDTEQFDSESDAYVTCNLAGTRETIYFSKISHKYLTWMDIENYLIEYICEGGGYNMMVDIVNDYGDYYISDIIEHFEKDCLGIGSKYGYYDSNGDIQDKLENFINLQAQNDCDFWYNEDEEDDEEYDDEEEL